MKRRKLDKRNRIRKLLFERFENRVMLDGGGPRVTSITPTEVRNAAVQVDGIGERSLRERSVTGETRPFKSAKSLDALRISSRRAENETRITRPQRAPSQATPYELQPELLELLASNFHKRANSSAVKVE